MGFNRMVCRERFSQIGRALTNKKSDDRDAIAAVSELIAEVGQSKRLADAGAKPEHYSAWAQAALEDICLRSNPRTATQAQIIDLYAAAGNACRPDKVLAPPSGNNTALMPEAT